MNAQNDLANLSFLSLLGSMIFYWIGASFAPTLQSPLRTGRKQNVTFPMSTSPNMTGYARPPLQGGQPLAGDLSQLPQVKTTNSPIKDFSYWSSLLGHYGIILSSVLLGFLLLLRWIESGHFPLSNLYESLMFLSWSFTVIHLFLEYSTTGAAEGMGIPPGFQTPKKGGAASPPKGGQPLAGGALPREERFGKLLGAITTPSALLTNAFATFTLPSEMQEASPLVPALQSNWLMMHVTVMILSYAALILGSLLSIAFLIVTGGKEISFSNSEDFTGVESYGNNSLSVSAGQDLVKGGIQMAQLPLENKKTGNASAQFFAVTLDNLSYRILGIGFPFLTIGILSGAVWANEAWGSYWSWDPKETWALLTWLIFAIYLHTRLNKGWEGKKPAIIASLGFIIVWICYLGVNLIGEGLHSYGWMSS